MTCRFVFSRRKPNDIYCSDDGTARNATTRNCAQNTKKNVSPLAFVEILFVTTLADIIINTTFLIVFALTFGMHV